MAPLALASIIQGVLHVRSRQEAIDDILRQTATYATHNEQNIFVSTAMLLKALAVRPDIHEGGPACRQTLTAALLGRRAVINLTLLDGVGKTLCTSLTATPTNYAQEAWWTPLQARPNYLVAQQLYSPAARRNVLPVALPLRSPSGAFTGALVADLDMHWISQTSPNGRLPGNALMLIVDGNGQTVASNRAVPDGMDKAVASLGRDGAQHTFVTGMGERWRWAAEQIAGSRKIIAFAMMEPLPFGLTRVYLIGDILLPILMVVLASLAMWLGTERYVIRWTSYLKRVSAAYGQNHFALELNDLEEAPDEFKLLGSEMKNMATSIRERDRTLSAALQQTSAMAREIHHRIKNNLQIVASLISIYSQHITDRQAQIAFKQIMARVGALTLIQRLIDRNEADPAVDVKTLLTETADQLRILAADSATRYHLAVAIEDCKLPPDTATPIAFYAVEALSLGLFTPTNDVEQRSVGLFFSSDGPGFARLTIEDAALTPEALRAAARLRMNGF